jgi:hypothetical protein
MASLQEPAEGKILMTDLRKPSELVAELKALALRGRVFPPNLPRSGEDITADQLPVFGELLLVLARDLDKAQRKIEWLTWAITGLTAVLVLDAVARFFTGR